MSGEGCFLKKYYKILMDRHEFQEFLSNSFSESYRNSMEIIKSEKKSTLFSKIVVTFLCVVGFTSLMAQNHGQGLLFQTHQELHQTVH